MTTTQTARIRRPAVAGTFYSAAPDELEASVEEFLTHGSERLPRYLEPEKLRAVIAPHAGYRFSGAVAGTAYAVLRHCSERIRRVVLIGPSHRVAFRGIALSSAEAFQTPLGAVPVDRAACAKISELPGVLVFDEAHAEEHGLEVHLPFLQKVFRSFSIVPVVVGRANPADVFRVIEELGGGKDTMTVISSDLSHFLPDADARAMDARTSQAIELLQGDHIPDGGACGILPILGLLQHAQRHGLEATTLHLANSSDAGGAADRVVGYGAYLFVEGEAKGQEKISLDERESEVLLDHVKRALIYAAETHDEMPVQLSGFSPALLEYRSTFVTIKRNGELRGCIGSLEPRRPLLADVVHNAHGAAMLDTRFAPLREEELEGLEIHVTVLSPLEPIEFGSEQELLRALRPGKDGLVIQDGPFRASFLPVMWERLPSPEEFLRRLKEKAGMMARHWSPNFKAWRYNALVDLEGIL